MESNFFGFNRGCLVELIPPVSSDSVCAEISSSCDPLDGMGWSDETPATHDVTSTVDGFLLVNGDDAKNQLHLRGFHLPEDQ